MVNPDGRGAGGWYVQISAEGLRVSGGCWRLESDQVDRYRRAVADPVQGKRLPTLSVPWLSPRLSSGWLAFVTDVDLSTARNLVDSMTNEVVVSDHAIDAIVPGENLGYDEPAWRRWYNAHRNGGTPRKQRSLSQ